MASFIYNKAKTLILNAGINFATSDIRIRMEMTNSTADTEDDTIHMDDFTTEDPMDGANAVDKQASEAVTENLAGNCAFYDDTTNHTWAALGAGTRQVQGFIVYKFVTNDADSIPIAWIDTGGFPFSANGGDVTVTWNAAGVISLA
jgi:hypothetical protein